MSYKDLTAEELLKTLDRGLDVGVSVLNEDLEYLFLSQHCYTQLGLTPEQLSPGQKLEDCHRLMTENGLLNAEVIEENSLSHEQQRQTDAGTIFSNTSALGDGRTMKLVRTKLENGMTVSVSHDVTELVEKDKLLEDALMLGLSGYWLYDLKTKEMKLSKSLRMFFPDEMLEKVYANGINVAAIPEDRGLMPAAIKKALQDGSDRFKFSSRIKDRFGRIRLNQTSGQILRGQDGKPEKLRAFSTDITRDHEQSEALKKAKTEAEHASQAKSEFLANMSHEIRTPMNGILGMGELLANSDINDRQKDLVKVINNSAEALLTIINDILDFSKIEAGAMELDPTPFDLKEAVDDIAALFAVRAKDKGLELIVDYSPGANHHFIGDAGRIRQIMTNLLGNAVKFTEEGHVALTIRVGELRPDIKVIKVDVSDTGIGISPEKVETIFQKFTQADGSTTRLYGGTGLGLSISKCLVELMKGKIGVKSEMGKGTTFSFAIPLPVDVNARKVHYDTSLLKDRRVLIVDDVAVNRRLLDEYLTMWSMHSVSVASAVEAVREMRRADTAGRPYDLVVSDFLMPDMDGIGLAQTMNQDPTLRDIPIMMLSSCDPTLSTDRQRAIGIRHFMMKPFKEKRFYDALVNVISESVARRKEAANRALEAASARVEPDLDSLLDAPLEPVQTQAQTKTEILVAEDFDLNRDVVRLMLADTHYEPIFAENGHIAVETYKQNPDRFPVILMDVSMPVMDGYEATQKILEFEAQNNLPHTPILALTGHALKHDRDKCLEAGMDDYLSKPVKFDDLTGKLEEYMRAGKQVKLSA